MAEANEQAGKGISRRDALKLASGVVALGAGLGVPAAGLEALTRGRVPQVTYQLKFYRDGSTLLQTVDANAGISYDYANGAPGAGVALERAGGVTFPFSPEIVQGKMPPITGQSLRGAKYEVRFFSAKQQQTVPVNADVACLLDHDAPRLQIRFYMGKEQTPLTLPVDMLQTKCPG